MLYYSIYESPEAKGLLDFFRKNRLFLTENESYVFRYKTYLANSSISIASISCPGVSGASSPYGSRWLSINWSEVESKLLHNCSCWNAM